MSRTNLFSKMVNCRRSLKFWRSAKSNSYCVLTCVRVLKDFSLHVHARLDDEDIVLQPFIRG